MKRNGYVFAWTVKNKHSERHTHLHWHRSMCTHSDTYSLAQNTYSETSKSLSEVLIMATNLSVRPELSDCQIKLGGLNGLAYTVILLVELPFHNSIVGC